MKKLWILAALLCAASVQAQTLRALNTNDRHVADSTWNALGFSVEKPTVCKDGTRYTYRADDATGMYEIKGAPQCEGTTKEGKRCERAAGVNGFCQTHNPNAHRCGAMTKAGTPCQVITKSGYCSRHQNQTVKP